MARSLVLSLQKVLSPLLIFLLCCSSSSAQSASSQTLYWQYTITNGTNVFGAWSVCASGNLTVGITAGNSNLLNRAALPVYNIQGQRVFTNAAGSTVQHIVALLGNDNANLAADDLLYVQAPHVDSNGLAYLLDSPIVFGNGVYQYANLTIWPQTKTESYAPEGISAGLQVSSTPYPACPVTGNLVWAFSYTQLGTANGQSFTVCTTGLLTTSQLTSIGGQAAYTVVSASGSRQVTIGSDLTGSGNTVAQTVTGVASSSVDGADDYILASAPFLTSNGVTLQLSSPAVYASGTSAASYVTVQLSGGSVLEKAGATAAQVTSSRGFSVLNSQTLPLCPATQSFSWCLYAQSALAVDQAASHAGVWNVTASGTFTTQLATQTGGNHPNGGAYTPLAQYYVLTSITGTRTQVSSLTGTTTSTIVGLSPISAAYQYLANNRIYTTFPWLDEYGLLYTLDSAIVHPGGSVSSNQINLYGPRPVEGSEDTAAFAIFTYAKYTPGTALPTCSATSTPTTSIMYTYTATAPGSLLQWSSCVSAVLTVAGPYPTVVAGRNAYSVLGATGTRTYTVNGVSTVQTIVGVSDVIGDHTVYDAAPYSIYEGGVAFVLSSNAIFPGVTSKYDVLYIGDPNNYGYTIETGYERTFTAGVVSSISVAPGTTAPTTCQANQGGSAAATLMFSWTYTVNSPATSSTFGTWQVCASGQVTVSNSLQYPSKNLAIPAYSVVGFTGTRVYTDSRGSTVQQVQSLLGNGNANLAADDLLYAWYPFIDTSGIAFYLDSPAIYSDGSYQYNNVTLWPLSYRNTVESYSPAPQVSTGFQVSTATTPVACLLAARRVWAWSYTLSGTSNGAAFTICAAGLITTSSSATNFSGQQAYQVLAINGTRQVTIGADLSPSGASTLQNVIGLGGTSLDGADNVVLTSGPYLTSGGLTLQLDGDALFPAGSSSTTYVTVQLSGGAVVEKGGVAASATSSNSGFVLASSQTVLICPARKAFSFCYNSQGSYPSGQPWTVVAYGTFQTGLATSLGGNHEDGAYLPSAPYYTLTAITGTRVQTNFSGALSTAITGLAPVSAAYNYLADNRIWTVWPYLSEYGWLYSLASPILFPGAESAGPQTLINLCEATPVEHASPNWAYLNYQPSTPGSAVPACPGTNTGSTTLSIGYVARSASSSIYPWTSCVNAVVSVQGPYPTATSGRYGYTLLSANGTRVFTLNGVTTTQRVIGTSSVDLFDNNVYTQPGYVMQYGGFALLLDSPALFDNGASGSALIAVYSADGLTIYETNAESTAGANSIPSISFASGAVTAFQCSSASFPGSGVSGGSGGGGGGGSSGLSGGAIAGIVIGSVVGAGILLALLALALSRGAWGQAAQPSGKATRMEDESTNGHVAGGHTTSEASTNGVELA